jgi:hypothetical protein
VKKDLAVVPSAVNSPTYKDFKIPSHVEKQKPRIFPGLLSLFLREARLLHATPSAVCDAASAAGDA